MTVIVSGLVGLTILITLLFVTTNINDALNGNAVANSDTAIVNLFVQVCGNWGIFLSFLLVSILFLSGISSISGSARFTVSLANSDAFPCSDWVAAVEPNYKIPINALIINFVVACIFVLFALIGDSDIAFFMIIGVATVAAQISIGIPILLKVIYNPTHFPVTPYSLGWLSRPFGIISCIWLFATSICFMLPTEYPVTFVNMNWSFPMIFIVALVAAASWKFHGQYHFRSPPRYCGYSGNGNGSTGDECVRYNQSMVIPS